MRKLSFLLTLLSINVFLAQQIDQPVKELNQAEREQRKSMLTANPKEAKPEPFEALTKTTINPSTPTVATGTSDEVGVTPGSLSVSLTGGATYDIPIYTPPGINGVEPKISLAYNSQSGNGMAGWGWNITGLSSISRVPATMHHDGRVGGVNLNMQDRFALDGQRLILKDPSQTYGGLGTEYVTENYSNIRIIASTTAHPFGAQYGPASFTVYYPDGSVATYGEDPPGSFIIIPPNAVKTTCWGLRRFEDARKLRIEYEYIGISLIIPIPGFFNPSGQVLNIKRILYGHRDIETPINIINFEYYQRLRPERYFVGGLTIIDDALLYYIEIFGSGQKLKTYNLTHNHTNLNYNRLEKITETNGGNLTLNPTVFEYGDNLDINNLTITKTTIDNNSYQGNTHKVITGDFNGSGNAQAIIYQSNNNENSQSLIYYNDFHGGTNNGINRPLPFLFEDVFTANGLNNNNIILPKSLIGVINKPTGDNNTYFRFYEFANNDFQQVGHLKTYNFPKIEINNDCPEFTMHCGLVPDNPLPFENLSNVDEIIDKNNTLLSIKNEGIEPIEPIDPPVVSCSQPIQVYFYESNVNEYTLSWNHNDTNPPHYEVYVMEVVEGNNPPNQYTPIGSPITVYSNNYVANIADPNKQYRFYVRKICVQQGEFIASHWVGPFFNSVYTTFKEIKKKYINGDFNGDGITDVIAIEEPTPYFTRTCDWENNCYTQNAMLYSTSAGTSYFINLDNRLNSSNFVNEAGQIHYSDKIEVGDYNGNGKSDLFVFNNGRVRVYELNDNNQLELIVDFSDPKINTQKISGNRMNLILNHNTQYNNSLHVITGDFNGDGKTDFIIPEKEHTSTWHIFFSGGGSDFVRQEQGLITYYDSYPQDMQLNRYALHEFFYIPVDINNDGKTDLFRINNISVLHHTGQSNMPGVSLHGVPLQTRICRAINVVNNSVFGSQWFWSWIAHDCLNFNLTEPEFNSLLNYNYSQNFRSPLALHRHPIPLFLNHNNPHKQGELSFISHGRIVSYNTHHNNQIATSLRKITLGNGVEKGISYTPLIPSLTNIDPVYQSANLVNVYPYYGLSAAPSFLVVSELQRKSITANHFLKQRYRYYGAISRMDGLGFQGFQATTTTNWYTDADMKIFTNHKKYDATLRGALIEDITELGIRHPNPNLTVSQFVSKTVLDYQSSLSPNKVYKLNNFRQTAHDGLLNTHKITVYGRYDLFNNPREIYEGVFNNNVSEKTVMTYIAYENNPTSTSNYFIGRVRSKQSDKSKPSLPMLTEREEYDYNTVGLVSEIRKRGHNTPFITESNQFDTYGNITQKTITAAGVARVSSYEYDPSNRFVKKSTDVEGLFSQFTYYQPTGLLHTETTPYGLTTTHLYDTWGKKTRTTDYLNNHNHITYTWLNNRRTTRVTSALADTSLTVEDKDDLGRVTDSYFKNLQGLPGDTANTANVRLRQEYDYLNQVIRKSEPSTTTPNQWTTFEYDIYGRSTKVTLPSGREMNTTYNGLTTTVVDTYTENGTTINNTTTVTKNALGLERTKTDNGGTLTFNYDANDNLTTTNYGTHQVSITYDGWGRKSALTDPSAGTYNYTYNGFGEVLTEVTPNGTTTYNYAPSTGKLNSKTVLGISPIATNTTTSYQYYPATHANRGLIELITHLDSGESPSRTTTYFHDYDGHRRLNLTRETTPEARFEKQLFYDNLGRNYEELITATHLGTGRTANRRVRTTYQNGHFRSLQDGSNGNQNIYQINTINARNQVLTASLGNGLNMTNTYTALGFLTQARTTNASGVQVINLTSTFNQQSGNLTARNSSLFTNVNETNIRYDNLDRLTHYRRYRNNGTQFIDSQQDYMADGRITINAAGTYDYNDPNSRYRQSRLRINTNDNPYPVVNRQEQNVTYHVDKSPRTIQVNQPSVPTNRHSSLTFFNAISGRSRVDFVTGTNVRQKFYASDGSAEITRLPSGQVEIAIYLGGDAYSAPAVLHNNVSNQNNVLYLHRDYLGSIVAVTNQTGTITERRHFDAWGLLSHYRNAFGGTTLPDGVNTFLFLDRGYTGHEHLLSVGLVHMNGRLYDPILHRFLQPDNYVQDPSNTQNYNRYGYVYNNPFKFSDPSGEIIWGLFIAGAVKVGIDFMRSGGNLSFFNATLSFLNGFAGAFFGVNPILSFASSLMPSATIDLGGGFQFSISTSLAFGNSFGIGVNAGLSYTKGDWTFSASFDFTSFGNYNGFGKNSSQVRYSVLASYDDGKRGFSLGTNFWRGDFEQRTTYLGLRHGDFRIGYENDGSPFSYAGKILSNNTDMYRTAAAYIGIGDYEIQLNMFTGRSGNDIGQGKDNGKNPDFVDFDSGRSKTKKGITRQLGLWSNSEADMYRMGALTLGYKGFRFGINSEYVRDGFQNWFAHKFVSPQPGFRMLSNGWSGFMQYQTPYKYRSTLW